jgi:hypothetical protein
MEIVGQLEMFSRRRHCIFATQVFPQLLDAIGLLSFGQILWARRSSVL